jgi:hypothetical protein
MLKYYLFSHANRGFVKPFSFCLPKISLLKNTNKTKIAKPNSAKAPIIFLLITHLQASTAAVQYAVRRVAVYRFYVQILILPIFSIIEENALSWHTQYR